MIRASGVWCCIPSPAQNLRPAAVPITTLHGIGNIYVTKIGEERDTPHLIHHRNNSSSAHIVKWHEQLSVSLHPHPNTENNNVNIEHISSSVTYFGSLKWAVTSCCKTLGIILMYLHPVPQSGQCLVTMPSVWPRSNLFLTPANIWGAPPPHSGLRHGGTGQLSPGPAPGPFTLSRADGSWWLMMLNNLQFARDHSPGYKMPHCFSQSTFNKMQCGYFMIFLPSPHLSFKMGGT